MLKTDEITIGSGVVHKINHNNKFTDYLCNGNTPARYRQKEILTQCLDNLNKEQLQVGCFRGDSASYQQGVVELMDGRDINFFIRNISSTDFDIACGRHAEWRKMELNY